MSEVTQLFTDREEDTLRSHSLCRLATVSQDGTPHVVPVLYAFDGKFFYLSSDAGSRKAKNIARNPKVCFLIDEYGKTRWGVMIQGYAELLQSGIEYINAGQLLGWREPSNGRYIHEGRPQIIIRIKPNRKISWGIG